LCKNKKWEDEKSKCVLKTKIKCENKSDDENSRYDCKNKKFDDEKSKKRCKTKKWDDEKSECGFKTIKKC
jgi:hypothetical protein